MIIESLLPTVGVCTTDCHKKLQSHEKRLLFIFRKGHFSEKNLGFYFEGSLVRRDFILNNNLNI